MPGVGLFLIMLTEFTFTLTRLRYLGAAAQNIPTFRPDGKDAAYAHGLVTAATAAQAHFLAKFNEFNLINGALATEFAAAHDAAVTVYACMKSCYRRDNSCTAAIRRLPKQDKSPEQTLKRIRGLSACWSTLPAVPGTSDPFIVGPWTQAAFSALAQSLEAKITAADLAQTTFAGEQARLEEKAADWNNFINAALTQGRAMFKPNTVERAYIDRVPTAASTQEPAQATITLAESQTPGAVHLQFNANRATSFTVWHKGPGEAQCAKVGEVLLPGDYAQSGAVDHSEFRERPLEN